jgi:hypothetical protein
LLSNLRERLERVIDRDRQCLEGIALPTGSPEVRNRARETKSVSRPRRPAKRSPTEQAMRNTRSRQRLELLQQIQALREQGESILGIAQRLDWSRSTVYR